MNWRDLKPGQRVRITLEGEVACSHAGVLVFSERTRGGLCEAVTLGTLADSATKLELITPPIKMGDRVLYDDGQGVAPAEVLAVHRWEAWVQTEDGRSRVSNIRDLRHAS
jgi:co-chaperonin GroES (HSP10)